ncbi:MAG: hypothetical protein AAB575_05040 [Patescibacteria group bacterium]
MEVLGRQGTDWDANVFLQSYFDIEKKLREAGEKKLDYQTKSYADAFFLPRDRDYTLYEDEYNMPLPRMSRSLALPAEDLPKKVLVGGANGIFRQGGENDDCYDQFESVSYGSMTLYNIPPSDFLFIPKELWKPNDVIGSDAFSSCTAVIARTAEGVFYAHVTTEIFGVKELLIAAKKFFPDQEILVIRPEYRTQSGLNLDYEKRWDFLSKESNVRVEKYPYVTADSVRINDVNDFSILVSDKKVRVIGRHVFPNDRREVDEAVVTDFDY